MKNLDPSTPPSSADIIMYYVLRIMYYVDSYIQCIYWLPTPQKLLYSVANPAGQLNNKGKITKKDKVRSGNAPPPRARRSFRGKIKHKTQGTHNRTN